MIPRSKIGRFVTDTKASVALIAAFAFFAMIMAAGAAFDYASAIRQKAELQAAADAAAIAGAKEIPLAISNPAQVELVASNYARTNLGMGTNKPQSSGESDDGAAMRMASSDFMMAAAAAEDDGADSGISKGGSSTSIDAAFIEADNAVEVKIDAPRKSYFGNFLPSRYQTINVLARAQVMGMGKVCVLGLMDSRLLAGIHLDNSAALSAAECGVYSNSTSFASIRADADSSITAETICAAGGYWAQSSSSFEPAPTTDCPPIPDPLSDRPAPPVSSCAAIDLVIDDEETSLKPGTYCGGISIIDEARVTLEPGVYVIKDGPLVVAESAELIGSYVGFYLTGNDSVFNFAPDTTIDLGAPRDGPLAGLLFMEDRSVSGTRIHRIQSNNARQLLGTIYLPKSVLQIDANAPVADQSAYTAIVALRLWLKEGPTLVLNSDYSATDVPVPSAISGGRVILTQ